MIAWRMNDSNNGCIQIFYLHRKKDWDLVTWMRDTPQMNNRMTILFKYVGYLNKRTRVDNMIQNLVTNDYRIESWCWLNILLARKKGWSSQHNWRSYVKWIIVTRIHFEYFSSLRKEKEIAIWSMNPRQMNNPYQESI